MSGALKHFFDTVYYPCLDATAGRPYGLWVHGNDDVGGAVRAVRAITGGMRWTAVARPVEVTGAVDAAAREACHDLGGTVAANLLEC
jgi:NAD(P)H-dependent FMN reductase